MPATAELLISALGMVSNVGRDVVTACAAQRAGLVRPYPLEGFWCFDESELESPVVGAPIKGLTDGFIQSGTWVRMALESLEDLVHYGALPEPADQRFWSATGLAWVLPEIAFQRFLWPETAVPALLERYCGHLLAELAGLPLKVIPRGFITTGPSGIVTALDRSHELLMRGLLERVVVLGSDSWLDRLSMDTLIRESRLKMAEQPVGLCPGEAAACVLVERAEQAARRSARAEAQVLAIALRPPPGEIDEEEPTAPRLKLAPALARNLASAITEALQAGGGQRPFRGDLFLDLNGEEWKALVWGHAQTLLHTQMDLDRVRTIVPCTSFGDIGAASGVAALCLATRSFVRSHALTEQSLICSISDNGETGAILVAPCTRLKAGRRVA